MKKFTTSAHKLVLLLIVMLIFSSCSKKTTNNSITTPSPESISYKTLPPVEIVGTLSLSEISTILRGTPARVRTVLLGTSPVDIEATYLKLVPYEHLSYLLCSINTPVAAGMSGSPLLISTPQGWKIAGAVSMAPVFERHAPFHFLATPLEDIQSIRKSKQQPSRLKVDKIEFSSLPILYALSGVHTSRHSIISDFISNSKKVPTFLRPAASSSFPSYEFFPGAPVGVSIIRGEKINLAAVGTVTWREGNNIWLFGHPFWWEGKSQLPVVGAHIHAIFTHLRIPYKYASIDKEKVKGTVTQDRYTTLLAKLDTLPDELKVQTKVRTPPKNYTHYVPYIKNTDIAALFTGIAAAYPLDSVRDSMAPGSIGGQVKIKFKETAKEVNYKQLLISSDPVFSWREEIRSLLDNFLSFKENKVAEATPTLVEFSVDTLTDDIKKTTVTEITAPSSVEVGKTLEYEIFFRHHRTPDKVSKKHTLTVPANFPKGAATLKVESDTSCPSVNIPSTPTNLDELIDKVNSKATNPKIAVKLISSLEEKIVEECLFIDYDVDGKAKQSIEIR